MLAVRFWLQERLGSLLPARSPAQLNTASFTAPAASPAAGAPAQGRNLAIDAFRGLVMVMLMTEAMHIPVVAAANPQNSFLQLLNWGEVHSDWVGLLPHDMIQPAFTFLVGAALPFSIRARRRKGASLAGMTGHAAWRALVLVALGIFIRSTSSPRTNFTFEDTLTQIGLGYLAAFGIAFLKPRQQWAALAALLAGYWLAWALYPAPGAAFSYLSLLHPSSWIHAGDGFGLHWSKGMNLGAAFDLWFLNLFPRQAPFTGNAGGYVTLSFLPTIGTMVLGIFAGPWFRDLDDRRATLRAAAVGVAAITAGLLLHVAGICPSVKRLWTPSWTIESGGVCFLCLAALAWFVRGRAGQRCVWPMLVVGSNSISAYMILSLMEKFVAGSLLIHLGSGIFLALGPSMEPLLLGTGVFAVYWLILYWMYRQKIFVRI